MVHLIFQCWCDMTHINSLVCISSLSTQLLTLNWAFSRCFHIFILLFGPVHNGRRVADHFCRKHLGRNWECLYKVSFMSHSSRQKETTLFYNSSIWILLMFFQGKDRRKENCISKGLFSAQTSGWCLWMRLVWKPNHLILKKTACTNIIHIQKSN